MRSRGALVVVGAALAIAACCATACSAFLGLDAPTLAACGDDCADGGTDGASRDASGTNDGPPFTSDASCATDAPKGGGVQCGGGCFAVSYCTGASPVCCQQGGSGQPVTYACVATASACTGFPILCASDDDCPGSEICCRTSSDFECKTTSSCPSSDIVCRPSVTDDCPSGKKCDVPVVLDGATSAYLVCQP